MKKIVLGLGLMALVGCGAAGEPVRPTGNIGLSIGPNGVTPSANVGASAGPVSLNVGL